MRNDILIVLVICLFLCSCKGTAEPRNPIEQTVPTESTALVEIISPSIEETIETIEETHWDEIGIIETTSDATSNNSVSEIIENETQVEETESTYSNTSNNNTNDDEL